MHFTDYIIRTPRFASVIAISDSSFLCLHAYVANLAITTQTLSRVSEPMECE